MADFVTQMQAQPALSEEQQKKVGQAKAGDMDQSHTQFLKNISGLIESGVIDVNQPETFIHRGVYEKLSDEWKAKTDQLISSMAILLYHIHGFYRSKQTPDSSPQLQSMIEQLWEMKRRMGSHSDVFTF